MMPGIIRDLGAFFWLWHTCFSSSRLPRSPEWLLELWPLYLQAGHQEEEGKKQKSYILSQARSLSEAGSLASHVA